MTKSCNYLEIEEACNCLWVTTKEIKIILGGVSDTKANSWRVNLEKELDQEKANAMLIENVNERNKALAKCFYYDDIRPHKLPIRRVLEKAHVDIDFVRREANKMRKALKIMEGE